MFEINFLTLRKILEKFNIKDDILKIEELLRFAEEDVRIILKVIFDTRNPVVIKIRNEATYTRKVFTQQAEFSEHLRNSGIETAKYYLTDNEYVYTILDGEKELYVTIEDFRRGEIKTVTPEICYKAGRLLAETHNISERDDCHVEYGVLFDVFAENDLFGVDDFLVMRENFDSVAKTISDEILETYNKRLQFILPLKAENKFAVQGDLSDCNMFETQSGNLGLFDFNNCGDANLFCDAVMQCVFMSRLMEYGIELTKEYSYRLCKSFLKGYNEIRPFNSEQIAMIPHLYAIIDAFWKMDLVWNDDSLKNVLDGGDKKKVMQILTEIKNKINGDFYADLR